MIHDDPQPYEEVPAAAIHRDVQRGELVSLVLGREDNITRPLIATSQDHEGIVELRWRGGSARCIPDWPVKVRTCQSRVHPIAS